ncbi:TraM recognition domain-containing protein [Fictibacillus sp. KIGAM418]|uniref:TraM recognition domain-containing protein n=1 Tax=Fictibacillus marinisediminis TaxID=2878389 RepID=A0A9X1XEP2_9BACL|nr:TraM recognition domain-containing protein [Fictibacillus marinisediminis]MCK6259552.1 TraM recognition domain-containing protein [Fictibacillus marinisediminis]
MNEKLKRNAPLLVITMLFAISVWFLLRAMIKYILLFMIPQNDSMPILPLIGNAAKRSLVELIVSTFLFIAAWALATRITHYQKILWRWIFLVNMVAGITFQYGWNATAPVYSKLLPYFFGNMERIEVNTSSFLTPELVQVITGNVRNLQLLILALPGIAIGIVLLWLGKMVSQHQMDLIELFKEWEYKSDKLGNFFRQQEKEKWPDVQLGKSESNGEMVVLKGKDRALNKLIVGSIGTGKSAALMLPMINQDLHHMTRMINSFKADRTEEDYISRVQGMHLNGMSIIDPSNELCKDVMQLVKAHQIPEESVFYIDPTNPHTPSINPMMAPVDKVAEIFTEVIAGLGESSDYFFEQSQRVHLKHYIYLCKLHEPGKEVTFDDLIDMYNDPQLVYLMHLQLKKQLPTNISEIEDRDERNHWKIVKGISDWFEASIGVETVRKGPMEVPLFIEDESSLYFKDPKVYDKKAEHVVGLRNILNDMAANILLRRVLFGRSDFDFDKHLEYGGILLLNTALGELSALSSVLGKFVLLSLQNAVFRRTPKTSAYHPIYVDEFPEYINRQFASFPAQSRKYKVIVTVATQTLAQLQLKYGADFMQTLLGTLRNKFVYGDANEHDSKLFSSIFGEKITYTEAESEQQVSALFDSPSRRGGSSYTQTKEAILSQNDLIYLKEFRCAVKIVSDNRPMPVQVIKANFVPQEEFEEAKVEVNYEAGQHWLSIRNAGLQGDRQQDILIDPIPTEQDIIDAWMIDTSLEQQQEEKKEETVVEVIDGKIQILPLRDPDQTKPSSEIKIGETKVVKGKAQINDNMVPLFRVEIEEFTRAPVHVEIEQAPAIEDDPVEDDDTFVPVFNPNSVINESATRHTHMDLQEEEDEEEDIVDFFVAANRLKSDLSQNDEKQVRRSDLTGSKSHSIAEELSKHLEND